MSLSPSSFSPHHLEIFAARGCVSKAQENSTEAFDAVDECNIDRLNNDPNSPLITGISPSIIVTDEGVAVCCHEENLRQLTGHDKAIRKLKADDIKKLRFKVAQDKPEASFVFFDEEFLKKYLGQKNLKIMLDIKSHSWSSSSTECRRTAEVLMNIVFSYIEKNYETSAEKEAVMPKVIFNSSSPFVMDAICKAQKKFKDRKFQPIIGYDYNGLGIASIFGCLKKVVLSCIAWSIRRKEIKNHTKLSVLEPDFVNKSFLEELHAGNRKVMVYGIENYQEFAKRGVSSVVDYMLANV